ncbi:MAG: GNAT family N-acetyltransferase [Eubacteriales bacterium]|nr:GNAT family N-acetyltransferase [Eubacteriales bacterium]
MSDMLVKLYDLKPVSYEEDLRAWGVAIKRPVSVDKARVLQFVRENFGDGWANECECALIPTPATCYIAVKDKKVVGFACYDVAAKNFFGPTGVREDLRGKKIGAALLHRCMNAMHQDGYGYAIIGWASDRAVPFYQREVNAVAIEGSFPGEYGNMVEQ